jgi:hypothetical protein
MTERVVSTWRYVIVRSDFGSEGVPVALETRVAQTVDDEGTVVAERVVFQSGVSGTVTELVDQPGGETAVVAFGRAQAAYRQARADAIADREAADAAAAAEREAARQAAYDEAIALGFSEAAAHTISGG